MKEDQVTAAYTYADSGTLKGLSIVVSKDRPGGWRMVFSTTEPLTAASFGRASGHASGGSLPDEWYQVLEGPMNGVLVHKVGVGWLLEKPPFTLSRANSDGDQAVTRWACETGQAGVKAASVSDFTHQCKELVRSKALIPDSADFHSLGINTEVRIEGDCNYAWRSDFTAKNAFGQDIKHNFTCNYSSKTAQTIASLN